MTTILVDSEVGFMAADRMVTDNECGVAIPCETKIYRVGGYLAAFSGMEGSAEYFMDWLKTGDWDDPPEPIYDIHPEDEFGAILLGEDGIWVADKFCRPTPINYRYYASGSGGQFAWAVLEAGCGVETAMEVAIKMDPNSGVGDEVVYFVDE